MVRIKGKKGLSPLGATVILVAVAVIIIALLFVWMKNVEKEEIEKFNLPARDICQKIGISAELSGTTISITNRGGIPIYGINIEIVRDGEITTRFLRTRDGLIESGETDSIKLTTSDLSGQIDELAVVPLILGESKKTGDKRLHTCSNQGDKIF